MKNFFHSENKSIVNHLCRDLGCSKEEVLDKVSELLMDQKRLVSEKEAFDKYCVNYAQSVVFASKEKASGLLAETKKKCDGMKLEAQFQRFELGLETRFSDFGKDDFNLNHLCKDSEAKDYVFACTPDETKAIFRRSDFERDARFLSCGLYPFLFSDHFKNLEREDGSRELKDLDGVELKLLSQGMKNLKYKIKGFKDLDKDDRCVFSSRLSSYLLTCKDGVLGVSGTKPNRSVGWSDIREETHGEKVFTYYTLRLSGVDFEFVAVPVEGDGEVEFMMSHWVTQRQWEAVTQKNPAYFSGYGLDLPMENISYHKIERDFLYHLNIALKEEGFKGEFKLPSKAQWQEMANENVVPGFERNTSKYSDFGQDLNAGQPLPVKSKVRGHLGAWMFGSVWEWVGTPTSGEVAICGGSCFGSSEDVGPFAQFFNRSDEAECFIGFRLLRTSPEED
ncbi:MAG: formylglycine-generating enzyme family protein [Oligoflexales bacterium]